MTRELEGYIIPPEDILTEELPLIGSFYFFLDDGYQYKGVRLRCSGCGFDER